MKRTFLLCTLVVLLFAVSIASVSAQDTTPEPADSQATTSQIVQEIDDSLRDEVEKALIQAEQALAEAEQATDWANQLLSTIQTTIGLVISIASILGAGFFLTVWKAPENIRKSLESDFKNTPLALSLLQLAEGQYLTHDYQGALGLYRHALELVPNNPVINYLLASVHILIGNVGEAENYINTSLQLDKDFPPAQALHGYIIRRKAQELPSPIIQERLFEQSQEILLRVLGNYPKLVDLDRQSWWGALGSLYRRREEWDLAIEAYTQATQVTPHSSYPFGNLAYLHGLTGNYGEMEKNYEQCRSKADQKINAEPDNYWWYNDFIISSIMLDKYSDAAKVYDDIKATLAHKLPYIQQSLISTLNKLEKLLDENQDLFDKQDKQQKIAKEIKQFLEICSNNKAS